MGENEHIENNKNEPSSQPQPSIQKNRKRGRPKWQPPELDVVEKLASRGLTDKQIAEALGICHDTLIEHKRQNSEFFESIKRGRAQGLWLISNALFAEACQGSTTAAIFYLRCRDHQNWNDRPVQEPAKETQTEPEKQNEE